MIVSLLKLIEIASDFKWWMLLAALLGFLTIGSAVGLMMTAAYIIAKAALQPSIAELQLSIVGVRFFGISRGVFRYFERLISHRITFQLLSRFRTWFYGKLEPLVPAKIREYRSPDLLTRLISDVENLEHIYVRVLAPPLIAVFCSFTTFFLYGYFSWFSAWILLIGLSLAGIGNPLLSLKLSKGLGSEVARLEKELNIMIVDGVQGLGELTMFGQLDSHFERISRISQRYVHVQKKMALIEAFHDALSGMIMNLTIMAMLLVIIPQINSGILQGVYLSLLIMGVMAVFEAVHPLPQAFQYLERSLASSARILEIADREMVEQLQPGETSLMDRFDIEFQNLNFSYPDSDRPILQEISIKISPAQKIAIVGPSGSGKSTLVHLLCGLWQVPEGQICLDGKSINKFSQEDIISRINLVSQKKHLFLLTIRDNLRLSRPQSTEREIHHLLQKFSLSEKFTSLSLGLDSMIGEQGLQLSGGERQLLTLVRGFLKESPVVVLDEPTMNLDAISAEKILNTILDLTRDKTLILVSHRLIGLEQMDYIIVLNKGRIVEYGNYQQLMDKKGIFERMIRLQAGRLSEITHQQE